MESVDTQKLVEVIIKALPKDAIAHYISVGGSRAKGLHNNQSDFDIRVFVSYPKRDYMLQKQKNLTRIETEYDGVLVEGDAMDIMLALKYSIDTNHWIYDAFISTPILETPISN